MSLFKAGQIAMTKGVNDMVAGDGAFAEFIFGALKRHLSGDWGDVCREDAQENEWSLAHGERLLSSYIYTKQVKVWIITEADRSVTTILFPDEY